MDNVRWGYARMDIQRGYVWFRAFLNRVFFGCTLGPNPALGPFSLFVAFIANHNYEFYIPVCGAKSPWSKSINPNCTPKLFKIGTWDRFFNKKKCFNMIRRCWFSDAIFCFSFVLGFAAHFTLIGPWSAGWRRPKKKRPSFPSAAGWNIS